MRRLLVLMFMMSAAFCVLATSNTVCARSLRDKLINDYYSDEKFQQAEDMLHHYIEQNPEEYIGYFELANLLYYLNRSPAEVVMYLEKAHELAPDNKDVNKLLSRYYSLMGKKDKAYELFDKATQPTGKDLETDQWYIESAYAYGDMQKALELCERAISNNREQNYLLLLKFYILDALGRGKEGADELLRHKNEDSGYFFNVAADYYMREGNLDKVNEIFAQNVKKMSTGCSRSLFKSAILKMRAGELNDAYTRMGQSFGFGGLCPYPSSPHFSYNHSLPNVPQMYIALKTNLKKDFVNLLYDDQKPIIVGALKDNAHFQFVRVLFASDMPDGKEIEKKYYLQGIKLLPLNWLAPPAKDGLFNAADLKVMEGVAEREEAGMPSVSVPCPSDDLPAGIFFGKYNEEVNDLDLVRFMKKDDKCSFVLYSSTLSADKFTLSQIDDFRPLFIDEGKEFMNTFFYEFKPNFMYEYAGIIASGEESKK